MTVPIQLDLHVSEVKTQLDPPTYLRAGSYASFGGDVILTYGDQADVSYTLFQASALQGTVHLLPERLTTYPTPLTKQNPKGSLDSGTTQQIMLTADATAPVGGPYTLLLVEASFGGQIIRYLPYTVSIV